MSGIWRVSPPGESGRATVGAPRTTLVPLLARGGTVAVVAWCLFLAGPSFWSSAEAQLTAKLPSFVLKDNGGDVIGIVVGFQKLGEFSLAMDDPDFSNDVPVQVTYNDGKFQLDGPENVHYTGMNCTGTAYVIHASVSTRAMSRLLGRTYAVGPSPGASNSIVYRGQAAAASPQPPIQTRYSGGTCTSSSAPGTMAEADPIIDITTNFGNPTSWTME